MESQEYRVVDEAPIVSDYRRLRAAVGWEDLPANVVRQGLGNALYSVSVYSETGGIVGCGRVLGDGGMYFYIQDVIVLPEHQGKGLGQQIMDRIMSYLGGNANPGTFVGLMATVGAEVFYEKYSFRPRPKDRPGMYLIWGQ